MISKPSRLASASGYTMVEMLITVLLIMIMAAIAVPQYFKMVEKSKVIEATDAIQAIAVAQTHYNSKYGAYCTAALTSCSGFEYSPPSFQYFTMGTPAASGGGWTISFTRTPGTGYYGPYFITGTSSGGAPHLTCSTPTCQSDLVPLYQ